MTENQNLTTARAIRYGVDTLLLGLADLVTELDGEDGMQSDVLAAAAIGFHSLASALGVFGVTHGQIKAEIEQQLSERARYEGEFGEVAFMLRDYIVEAGVLLSERD